MYKPVEIDRRRATKDSPATELQMRILRFAYQFYKDNDQFPTGPVTAEYFGWSAGRSAQAHFTSLAKRGYLEKNVCGRWKFTEKALAAVA